MNYTTFYVITKAGYLIKERVYLAYRFGGESLSIIAWALLKTSWLNHLMVDGVLTGFIHIFTHMRERSHAEKESQRVARVPQQQPYAFPKSTPCQDLTLGKVLAPLFFF